MRVSGGTEGRVLGGRTHGEFVEVGFADEHRSRGSEAGDHGGVVRGTPPVQNLRRTCGGNTPSAHVVFQGDGHSGERTGITAGRHESIDRLRARPGGISEDQIEGVHIRFGGIDTRQVFGEDGGGGASTGPNVIGDSGCRPGAARTNGVGERRGHHATPRMLGTRN